MKQARGIVLPSVFAVAVSACFVPLSAAFVVPSRTQCSVSNKRSRTTLEYKNLPTAESLSTNDSFTDQTFYASMIVRELSGRRPAQVEYAPDGAVVLLEESATEKRVTLSEVAVEDDEDKELSDLLSAQLSHRDGIRGFFAVYLAGEGDTVADQESVPTPLIDAMKKADMEAIVTTACMNVVMSTAMTTMYNDPILRANSAKMAKRSKRVLSSLEGSIHMMKNCQAIVVVATGAKEHTANAKLVKLWKGIFKSYKYQEEQLRDIVIAFTDLV